MKTVSIVSCLLSCGIWTCCHRAVDAPIDSDGGGADTGADADADGDADTDTDADSDTDTDIDADTDVDPDTGVAGDCGYTNPWDEVWTYGEGYAEGPYGFKGSVCWDEISSTPTWSTAGDTIPNICLNDQDDFAVCLGDFLASPDYELLFVHYFAMWVGPCNDAADSEQEFVAHLESQGWTARWITILGEDMGGNAPTVTDANAWIADHELGSDAVVLYDAEQEWYAFLTDSWPDEDARGWPTFSVVHTSNLLQWMVTSGWGDPDDYEWAEFLEFWAGGDLSFLDWASTKEGAIDG